VSAQTVQMLAYDDEFAGRDPVAAAAAYIASAALTPTTTRQVGLELEFHLVDLTRPGRRPDWSRVTELVRSLPAMPSGSSVTLEPGGQIELSTPPHACVEASVAALAADRDVLRTALAAQDFGAAPLGADPARAPRRTNPHARYDAMEHHFEARGCGAPGRSMMTATAALQINLDAGPREGWSARLHLLRSMVPMLVAASAGSPYLGGRASGWHSMRQETWHGIDHGRSDPICDGEPSVAWALYALDAPVMLVRDGEVLRPVTERVTFGDWLNDPRLLGRAARLDDLDYHLTTLFPPVRPRGYLELRCIDALPDRWWPAMAALVVTLADDPVAADRAAEICEPVADRWEVAARRGLDDPALHRAVVGCVEVALARVPEALKEMLETFAELVTSGRTPYDQLRDVALRHGPLHLLEEEARA